MRKIFIIIITLLTSFGCVQSQTKLSSEEVLKKILQNVDSSQTMIVDLTISIHVKEPKLDRSVKQLIKIKRNKYFIQDEETDVICDGVESYTIDKVNKEAKVILVIDEDPTDITPINMFTFFRNDYTSKSKGVKKDNQGRLIMTIELYPLNKAESRYSNILLYADTEKFEITKSIFTQPNGAILTYDISSISKNVEINDSVFIFDKTKYPKH